MPEGLTVFLESLLAYVGALANYLVTHQSVLNLVLLFSTLCLSILAIAAYARSSRDVGEVIVPRLPDRRPLNASRERYGDGNGDIEDRVAPVVPPPMPIAPPPPPAPLEPTDAGHRLSRLEESFLQLNRDLTSLEDTTRDIKHELELISMRLREPAPFAPQDEEHATVEPVAPATPNAAPVQQTALELVEVMRSTDLVPHRDVGTALAQMSDMAQRVDDLSAALDAQRRTVLAIGQVVAQMPDWRKLRPVLVESLERIATATDPGSRRAG